MFYLNTREAQANGRNAHLLYKKELPKKEKGTHLFFTSKPLYACIVESCTT